MPEVIVVQGNLARQEELKCRVGAYARVSSDSDDQLNSFFNQVQHYTKLIKSNPEWEYVDIYADEGVTGTRADKRSDFNRMIKDCEDGKLDKIITKSISRFARNAVDCVKILKHLKNFGVSVIFEEDHLDSSNPSDFTMICAKASLAEEQSKSTAENVRMGNRYRMQEGTYVQSNPPIGFILKDKVLVINEEQAPVIKRIFDSYLAGKSTSRIAEELMRDRIPNKYGKVHWTSAGISYIISNVRYKGDAILQKSFKTGFPYKQVPNNGELPKFYVHNDNEPIVDESTYRMNSADTKENAYLNSNMFLVGEKAYLADKEGNRYVTISGLMQAGSHAIDVYENKLLDSSAAVADIDEGDLIRYRKNETGSIIDIQMLYDYDAEGDKKVNWTGVTDTETLFAPGYNANFQLTSGFVSKKGEKTVSWGYKSATDVDEVMDLSAVKCMFYDGSLREGSRLYTGSMDSIADCETAGADNCDIIIVQLLQSMTRSVVVYKR